MVLQKLNRNELIKSYGFVEQLASNEDFLQVSVELASKILECQITYISLIDEEKQYILKQHGSSIKTIAASESICQYAIETDEQLVIENTLFDERTKELPLVVNDKIAFYAGSPLTNAEGVNVGALCAIDFEQKKVTTNQLEALKILGKHVINTLDNQRGLIRLIKKINSNFKPAACADINCLNGELEHLSSEVILQNQKVISQKQELEESNKKLKSFAHIIAHDVKAPLRTIKSFIQIIKKDLELKYPNYNNEHFEFIKTGVSNLEELTTNLLASAKVNSKQTNQEALLLNDVLETVTLNLNETIQKENVEINLPNQELKIFGDRIQLMQLFQNLISNGIKYQEKGNKPIISISASEQNGKINISITDNGIGISDSELEDMFLPYNRLSNASEFDGYGIGLSTCKQIIENHNSSISVSSQVGVGTKILFQLPGISCFI